ncbi:hypothetical protein Q5X66_11200 [Acinetobacter baumannii]|nr:hypothetical protein [Acinetobacter baumannii]
MNKSAFAISIFTIGLILLILLFSIFGILYFYWGNVKAVQDSLSTTGSIFGAIATLGAAGIAIYLFNDWREQERTIFIRSVAYDAVESITHLMDLMQGYPESDDYNVASVKVTHTKITTKLSIINRQIFDPKMEIVNKNFGVFIQDYFDIVKLKIDSEIDQKVMKVLISDLIYSYRGDFNYLAKLTDIHNIKN